MTPVFDFDSYDWSDPAAELNQKAREKYNTTWKNDSRAGKIKAEVDAGAFPTDEAFFGVWDEASESFTTQPMLNYDYDSYYDVSMEAVLEAVKEGDYLAAKEALLEYYRQVNRARGLAAPDTNKGSALMSNFLLRNFHVNNNWGRTALFEIGEGVNDITVDVLTTVEQYRDSAVSMIILGVDKDDYYAEFYSREGGDVPYLEVTVGSGTRRINALRDGYVSGGSGAQDTSGGRADRLYARESAAETTADGQLTDDRTRRTYLWFDLASAIPSGEISSATLHLKGGWKYDGSEAADPSYRKLMAIVNNGTAWTEDNLCFANQDLKSYAYSMQNDGRIETAYWGWPVESDYPNARQDQELLRFGTWWDVMAKEYYATGNEDYARACMLYLYDFIQQTFLIERGEAGTMGQHSGAQTNARDGRLLFGGYSVTLDASSRASGIAKNFNYIIDSDYMTGEIFTTFLKYFKKMGDHFVDDIWGGSENGGNWGTAQVNGHFAIMAYFPEIADEEVWKEAIRKHLAASTSNTIRSDGSSHELSHSYTSYALGTQLGVYTMAEEMHIDFPYDDTLKQRIKDLTVYMMRMANPGGTDPQYGDAGSYTRSYVGERFEFVGDWLNVPELQWMAYEGKKGTKPEYTSYYYPVGKTLAMRTDWSDDALYLHTTADAAEGTHSHWDDGGLIVSAYGNYLLSDQGYNGYLQDNIPHRWLVSSRGHNTVEINDFNQNSKTPNTMDTSLANQGGNPGDFKNVTFHDSYDYMKLDLSSVYKNLQYHYKRGSNEYYKNPGIAPGEFVQNEFDEWVPKGDDKDFQNVVEPGMQFQRNVLFVKPNFWIVSDYMNPFDKEKVNKYSQYWHMTPQANISIDGQYVPKAGEKIQWQHSTFPEIDKQIRYTEYVPGTGNGAFRSNFTDKANIQVVPVGNVGNIGDVKDESNLAVAAENGTIEPRICYGYYEGSGSTPYGRFDKYAQGTTGFDTILFPTKTGEIYSIEATPLEISGYNTEKHQGAASAFTADFTAEKAATDEDYTINYFIMHEADKKDAGADMTFGDYVTDGALAYYEVSAEGIPRRAIIQNGSHIANSGMEYELVKSTDSVNKLSDLSIEWNGSKMIIEGAGDMADVENGAHKNAAPIDLSKLTVYAPYQLNEITFNGEAVPFKQANNYVYFGDAPIEDGGDIFTPPGSGDNSSKPGSSKPSHGGGGGGTVSGNDTVTPPVVNPDKPSDSFKAELSGHWAEKEISALVNGGIIAGSDNSLHLQDKTTRAEFTKMILGALDIKPAAYEGCFGDVKSDDWYAGYMQAAYNAGIVGGYNGNANPNDTMTREEAVKIMLKALETKIPVNYSENGLNFADAGAVSDWAKTYMETAVSMGLISGMEDNTLRPQDSALREQAMVIVYRVMQTVKELTQQPMETE